MELVYTVRVSAEWQDGTVRDGTSEGIPCSDLYLGPWTGEVIFRDGCWFWYARHEFICIAKGTADDRVAAKKAAEAAIRVHAA